jgi:D-threo-aldose 1-dehydrogenase
MTGLLSPRLALGYAQLGNLPLPCPWRGGGRRHPREEAWNAGIRQFDTAPHYGLGLSERRLGALPARQAP